MRAREGSKRARLYKFCSRLSLKRWLPQKQRKQDFFMADEYTQLDDTETDQSDEEELLEYGMLDKVRHSFSGAEFGFGCSMSTSAPCPQTRHSSATLVPQDAEILRSKLTEKHQFKVFTATWNVGGKPPNEEVALGEWLSLEAPADIYVIGFQEVVPLNVANVLGSVNTAPAAKWLHLISQTLNSTNVPCESLRRSCSTPLSMWQNIGNVNTLSTASSMKDTGMDANTTPGSLSSNETGLFTNEAPCMQDINLKLNGCLETTSLEGNVQEPFLNEVQSYSLKVSSFTQGGEDAMPYVSSPSLSTRSSRSKSSENKSRFTLIASKQMVGLFVSIWIRGDLRRYVRNLNVSCVACGLLGCLGNKGSISFSMTIHQTSFCFVCSHLTSGQRDKDELKRNSDVFDILKRTRFHTSRKFNGGELFPEIILDHDSVIWLGDLNYRLALTPNDTRILLEQENWNALLDKDQLNVLRKAGRVFAGWQEGEIAFPPTYKYCANSDCYALEKLKGEKHRTPAWCDRILWYGSGLKQHLYVRAETRLSDHRPVFAVFTAEVEALSHQKLKEFLLLTTAKVQAEELLPTLPLSTYIQEDDHGYHILSSLCTRKSFFVYTV